MSACIECGATTDVQDHHVIPRSFGGTATVPLCAACHNRAHGVHKTGDAATLIRLALQGRRDSGRVYGGLPYGYTRAATGDALLPDAAELATVASIRKWHAAGDSLGAIARRLTAANVPTKRGGTWWPATVRYLLRNDLYAVAS